MLPNLTANEARVIGCLMEKSVVTPDQYPLTVNALMNACNQKSGRDPVMSLEPGTVQRTARDLAEKHLVITKENFKTGKEKYTQRFCNTRFSDYQFDAAQFAVVCLLLLRGPQTPGELRARSGRLHSFANNAEVTATLATLAESDHGPLVVALPRTPGRRDSEYMHLFCGPVDVDAHAARAQATKPSASRQRVDLNKIIERLANLEAEVAALKEKLGSGPRDNR